MAFTREINRLGLTYHISAIHVLTACLETSRDSGLLDQSITFAAGQWAVMHLRQVKVLQPLDVDDIASVWPY